MNKPDILALTAALKLAYQRRVEQRSLDGLCGVMSRGKTVSKLRSAPAPYLAQAPAPKQGVGAGPYRGPTSTSPRCGRGIAERRTASRRDRPLHGPLGRHHWRKGTVE